MKQPLGCEDVTAGSKVETNHIYFSRAGEMGNEKVVRLLLGRKDVDADSGDTNCRTPLTWTLQSRLEGVAMLLLCREDVAANCKDEESQTPLSLAAQNGHKAVVALLLG